MIASAYPGQFGYVELLNMDARDLKYWFCEAQKKLIGDQIKRIQAARFAMVSDAGFERVISGLTAQMNTLEGKTVDGWESLRNMKRG